MNDHGAYNRHSLVREMLQTPDLIRSFRLKDAEPVIAAVRETGKVILTGEGSSRIFPAKNAVAWARRKGLRLDLVTGGSRQASEYDLGDRVVMGASNSGRTRELIALFEALRKRGHRRLYSITANPGTPLESLSDRTFLLTCGREDAVAATKSVQEMALFYFALLNAAEGLGIDDQLAEAAEAVERALRMPIDGEITEAVAGASTLYFAGRDDGVAEELALKTNEIIRRKSGYFEGTYALHGVEEVLNPDDVVLWIEPFEEEYEKIRSALIDGVGMKVLAISEKDTPFPTIRIRGARELTNLVRLAAGWNLLVEAGMRLGIDLDRPARARKVGNEFTG
ncbi:MAG TPA: SIS domain-containing protein [Spirochaetia bacterium]|nr:SIS domain-containing protein [Spirochaetales bacterium]HRY79247.1 SIS domain-containing protein [Spirochaetia bacterium]